MSTCLDAPELRRAFRSPKGRSGSLYALRSERMQNSSQYLIDLSPHDRLQKAGVLSGHFWLTL